MELLILAIRILISLSVTMVPTQVAQGTATTSLPIQEIATTTPPVKPTINELIELKAIKYGINPLIIHDVIDCESDYVKDAVGDYGTSFGLVQIHLPDHPTISKDQAFDPEFAINFLAENLKAGRGYLWTCYRSLDLSTRYPL